jgi:hypothetical protein
MAGSRKVPSSEVLMTSLDDVDAELVAEVSLVCRSFAWVTAAYVARLRSVWGLGPQVTDFLALGIESSLASDWRLRGEAFNELALALPGLMEKGGIQGLGVASIPIWRQRAVKVFER